MFEGKNVTAIVVAAGKGTRFGSDIPKQFLKIEGMTVLEKAVRAFENHPAVDQIVVVTGGDFVVLCGEILAGFTKVKYIVPGGAQRQDSVYEGLKLAADGLVLIHDGARPFVTAEVIDRVLEGARSHGA
ncbi:MAG: 2-C-methyl-D-erythritol 4-phosphate cytidylyltransferase, partial [Firmicutes bacterium]|nr:2-C-methyl-D-erythritol 4-phosphate cytidylyltransferase [Bacillota bacterium]